MEQRENGFSRRELFARIGIAIGVAVGLPLSMPFRARARAQAAASEAFISLTAEEAEILRAIISRIIPADENGPGALEARADRFIDRALAGAMKADRPRYREGLAALNAHARNAKGSPLAKLSAADQDALLTDVQQGRASGFSGSSTAFFNLVRTNTIQGTFADPFYGGNANFIGWDLIGYPGARIVVTSNLQRIDMKAEPSRKGAYDYGMFTKGEL